MKFVFLIVLVVIICTSVCEALEELFKHHVKEYELEYDAEQFSYRYGVFKSNMDLIEAHNAKSGTYTMGRGPFTHLTHEEFNEYASSGRHKGEMDGETRKLHESMPVHAESLKDAPTSYDWRNTPGVVTPVKNQGQCGSCWTFGASGAYEGAYAIANNFQATAYSALYMSPSTGFFGFSEQFFASCDYVMGDGCNGGFSQSAFVYAANAGGIPSEKTYPYTFENGAPADKPSGTCDMAKSASSGFISNPSTQLDKGKPYTRVTPYSVSALQSAVWMLPVTIYVQAAASFAGGPSPWQNYAGGIVTLADGCGQNLDHSVLAVGWNTDNTTGKDYWIIKNSWTATWGNDGYIYVEKSNENACGVLTEAFYPNMQVTLPDDTPTPSAAPTVNANATYFSNYISSNTSAPSVITVPGLDNIRQFRIDEATVTVSDSSITEAGNSVTTTMTPLLNTNIPSDLFGGAQDWDDGLQTTTFAVGIQADNEFGSKNTFVSVGFAFYVPNVPSMANQVSVSLYKAACYPNFTLPLNTNTLLSLTSPAGAVQNFSVPVTDKASSLGLGVSSVTISLQQTWPTAAPTMPPPPTPPLPIGNHIMSTNIEYVFINSDCTDASKISDVKATSYGLCNPLMDGTYMRTVPDTPEVTNPDYPITVPLYGAIYSDAACTVKTEDLPAESINSNYCNEVQPGMYVRFDYVINKASANTVYNIAPPSRLLDAGVTPVYSYTSISNAKCNGQNITQVASYVAVPPTHTCSPMPKAGQWVTVSCKDGTVSGAIFDNAQCSGSPVDDMIAIQKSTCGTVGVTWSTPCPVAPTPTMTPTAKSPTMWPTIAGGGSQSGGNSININTGGDSGSSDASTNKGMLTALLVLAVAQLAMTTGFYMKGVQPTAPVVVTEGNPLHTNARGSNNNSVL